MREAAMAPLNGDPTPASPPARADRTAAAAAQGPSVVARRLGRLNLSSIDQSLDWHSNTVLDILRQLKRLHLAGALSLKVRAPSMCLPTHSTTFRLPAAAASQQEVAETLPHLT